MIQRNRQSISAAHIGTTKKMCKKIPVITKLTMVAKYMAHPEKSQPSENPVMVALHSREI